LIPNLSHCKELWRSDDFAQKGNNFFFDFYLAQLVNNHFNNAESGNYKFSLVEP